MATKSMNTLRAILFLLVVLMITTSACRQEGKRAQDWKYLSANEYREAVYAAWIGQIIGNTYGLGYEFKFIDEPGPDAFPYGYAFTLQDLEKHNGAFSDDDTDIEYMYLTVMEEHGIEPTYHQLAGAWKKHVKERIWFANRMAVTLMHAGHYPPVTGMKGYNSEWFQIDPQLVNEIWAVTAPGMIGYAVAKSEYSARITSDSFGLEPTLHYAAMYSAAFFEKDINKLVEIGNSAIPENGRFYRAVQDVKQAWNEYPDDWQTARKIIKDKYYRVTDYNRHSWAAVDAILNGAFGVMALLYGQGDFQKTLDYCCAFGMDADNQAATMCGLLGVVNGLEGIPRDLMYPIEGSGWEQPFNNSYRMITRDGLEDAAITELAERTSAVGEKVILAGGGAVISEEGEIVYKINAAATFAPPFELNPFPEFHVEVNVPFSYPVYTGTGREKTELSVGGDVTPGIMLGENGLEGAATKAGTYNFNIKASWQGREKSIPVKMVVHSANLANTATGILCNQNTIKDDIELIRDGQTDKTYYSIEADSVRAVDQYGYTWDIPVSISSMIYNNGAPQEFGGWFTSFSVEYLEDDTWKTVENFRMTPAMNLDNTQWLKPAFMDYTITFPTVTAKGIRISGLSGGIEKDAANAHLGHQHYTSISELRVFPD